MDDCHHSFYCIHSKVSFVFPIYIVDITFEANRVGTNYFQVLSSLIQEIEIVNKIYLYCYNVLYVGFYNIDLVIIQADYNFIMVYLIGLRGRDYNHKPQINGISIIYIFYDSDHHIGYNNYLQRNDKKKIYYVNNDAYLPPIYNHIVHLMIRNKERRKYKRCRSSS